MSAYPFRDLCIKVIRGADPATVGDVIGYLSSSGTSLDGKTWRLVLNRYSCDPQAGCGPAKVYPGPTRHGPPPASTSCRVTGTGTMVTAPPDCHDTLAQAMATHGDWAGFYRLADGQARRFASGIWLCVSEQVRVGGSWPAPRPAVARACPSAPPA